MRMRKLHSGLSHVLDLTDLVAGRDQKVGIQTGDSRQTKKIRPEILAWVKYILLYLQGFLAPFGEFQTTYFFHN